MGVLTFEGLVGDFGLANWLDGDGETAEGESTGGDDEPVKWVPVAIAMGVPEAHLIAGRLNNEGIPTRISQEAAGAAIGLTVGMFQIRVLVPKPMEERALSVLDEPATIEDGEWEADDEEVE